jgi:hypothetical protein
MQQLGPLNLQGFRPSVTLQLPKSASFTMDSYFFWRQSPNDGIYNHIGLLLRRGDFTQSKFIGIQPGVELYVPVDKHFTVDLNYSYFSPGQFLHDVPPDESIHYVGLIFGYRF